MKTIEILLLFTGWWAASHQSVDLNLRQLQYVSDHLTIKECQRLIATLRQKTFQVKPADVKAMQPKKDDEPCLLHLVDWNQQSGDGATVEDLCVRLHQIGRVDLARDLARAVYGETAREIHKYFLDDPFKATAEHKGSRLMEDDEDEDDKTRNEVAMDTARGASQGQGRFLLAVVTLTLTLTCITGAIVTVYCPAACSSVCPSRLVSTVEAVRDSVTETLDTLKTLTVSEVLGKKTTHTRHPPPHSVVTMEEQDRLVHSILNL